MEQGSKNSILERLAAQKGHVGFYYKNLATGDTFGYQADEAFQAASVIKLPIYACIEMWCAQGKASMDEVLTVTEADKVPICGALTLFTGDVQADIATLCRLMISISDNTATNMLIKRFGIPAYQVEFERLGFKNTALNRLLFDSPASARGVTNTIAPAEIGVLLESISRRTFVSEPVSKRIEDTLFLQQINHKICGYLDDDVPVAHKTGEDEDLSNDVGIVYAKEPFVVCFAGHDTDVPAFETLIRQVSAELVQAVGPAAK